MMATAANILASYRTARANRNRWLIARGEGAATEWLGGWGQFTTERDAAIRFQVRPTEQCHANPGSRIEPA